MGTVALGVFSVILEKKLKKITTNQTRTETEKSRIDFLEKGRRIQEARTEILCDDDETIKMQPQS